MFGLLLKPEDFQIAMSLSDLGTDLLVAIDMCRWWKTCFSFDITMLEMLGMGALQALGNMLPKVYRSRGGDQCCYLISHLNLLVLHILIHTVHRNLEQISI